MGEGKLTSPVGVERMKTVIIGQYCVGKTSIALRFARDQFKETYKSTIAASFFAQSIEINNQKVIFQVWDTAGQERYRSLIPMYLRGSQVAFVVYDITDMTSFQNLSFWVDYLKQNGPSGIQIAIVGNKADLEEGRQVSTKDGKEFANEHECYFVEVSAKTGERVHQLFLDVAKSFISGKPICTQHSELTRQVSIKLSDYDNHHANMCCSGARDKQKSKIKNNIKE